MATNVLLADTLISALSLASGDTIDFNGHSLIIDTNALGFPFTPQNLSGRECNIEFRQGGAAKINASLPSTIHPYIDPANPLAESDYEAGLTGNASAELQFGNFSLGGGVASLPTGTRSGAFWGKVASSPSQTEIVFDRPLPLHPGDRMVCLAAYHVVLVATISSYDQETQKATFSGTLSRRSVGDVFALCSGGFCVNTSAANKTIFPAGVSAGTLNLVCGGDNVINGSALRAERFSASGFAAYSTPSGFHGPVDVRQLAAPTFSRGQNNVIGSEFLASDVVVGESATACILWNTTNTILGRFKIGGGIVADGQYGVTVARKNSVSMEFNGVEFNKSPSIVKTSCCRLTNCLVAGSRTGDVYLQNSGTATRTARTDFPADTDLPDAWAHAPNANDAVTWRSEDRWVRKGETLRIRARWMPAGASSRASVAVTELATWLPDLWQLGAEALAKAEFAAGMEQLKWHDGAVEWRNDTGEDCQVRVWECVSGDTLGGYLRVWEATGGAM